MIRAHKTLTGLPCTYIMTCGLAQGLLGVQTNMWEQGWGWQTRKPFAHQKEVLIGTSYVDIAISRSAGAGWWGYTWPRNVSAASSSNPAMNASAWGRSYALGAYIQSQLDPDCDSPLMN